MDRWRRISHLLDRLQRCGAVTWFCICEDSCRSVRIPRLGNLRCNRALDMWWLALALFLVCIIEVSISVVNFPQPHNTEATVSVPG